MKLEIVAAVNNKKILEKNLSSSPLIQSGQTKLHIAEGYSSASTAYLAGLENCTEDIVVFAHQDVYIPAGWELHLERTIKLLEDNNQSWAVLGVFGVDATGQYHGRVWSSGLNRELIYSVNAPQSIVSIDELLIVLNRKSPISFDADLPSFHLYGTDIVQTALQQNNSAFVFHAPVIHNSNPVHHLDKSYRQAYNFMRNKWSDILPIQTCIIPVTKRGLPLYISWLRSLQKILMGGGETRNLQLDSTMLAKNLGYECD